jgi:CDP-paratose 2-epimerase
LRILITGGCGFLGTNLADALLARGDEVRLFDDLSRPGTQRNLAWLKQQAAAGRLEALQGDIRDAEGVQRAVEGCEAVAHLAAQVAVTTSLDQPRFDFEVNALGTLNVLEAARQTASHPMVVFASTNKVYGGIEDVRVVESHGRYEYADLPHGVSEAQPLDFHSPYGCSKGSADQYVRDYHRIYDLPTVVFRMSCLYGPHQFGSEDQGWVAHFAISAFQGQPISIYGDGKQVRDVLYVADAVDAYLKAIDQREVAAGQIFNLGGGIQNTLSLLELLDNLETILGRPIERTFGPWRPGDQRVYVSDIRKVQRVLEWRPTVGIDPGVRGLVDWIEASGYFSARAKSLL